LNSPLHFLNPNHQQINSHNHLLLIPNPLNLHSHLTNSNPLLRNLNLHQSKALNLLLKKHHLNHLTSRNLQFLSPNHPQTNSHNRNHNLIPNLLNHLTNPNLPLSFPLLHINRLANLNLSLLPLRNPSLQQTNNHNHNHNHLIHNLRNRPNLHTNPNLHLHRQTKNLTLHHLNHLTNTNLLPLLNPSLQQTNNLTLSHNHLLFPLHPLLIIHNHNHHKQNIPLDIEIITINGIYVKG
jgi:hypothetical protein